MKCGLAASYIILDLQSSIYSENVLIYAIHNIKQIHRPKTVITLSVT